MINQPVNTTSNPQKLSAEIKKTWGKLTDEEIGFQASMPDKFYEAVKTKYSIDKDEAEKTVKKLQEESASASSNSSDTDNKSASAAPSTSGAPKAANDSTVAPTTPPKAANA